MRGFAGLGRSFGDQQRFRCGFHRGDQRLEVAKSAGLGGELLDFALDADDVLIEPRQTVAVGADIGFKLVALCGEVGERGGQFGEGPLRCGERGFGFRNALIGAAALVDARLDFILEIVVFGFQTRQRDVGVGELALLALDVGSELRQATVKLDDALSGARFFAVEHFAGVGQALQSCGGARFVLAQAGQLGGADRLDARGFRLLERAFGLFADVQVVGLAGFGDVGMGLQPAQVKQQCLGLADLGGDFAITDRLTRLLFQALDLAGQLADDVLDAGEVGLGRLEAQFGLVAARMQTGDSGGVFQHAAALVGTRLNDFADLTLVDEGRRTRAGGGVSEQNLDVARAHVAAVDAIDRTGFAFDAPGNFQHFLIVHRGRRRAIGIVDGHRHFGVIARGAVAGACEDHSVHVRGTQRLVRRFAHRPAQRFDQVRFAATVGTDDAGQTRLDQKIGRLNEGLESVKAKTREFHAIGALLAGAELPNRGKVIAGLCQYI